MSKKLEARIVVKKAVDGKREVVVHDPQTGRTSVTGLKVSGADQDRVVRNLKETMERAGNRATVIEQ